MDAPFHSGWWDGLGRVAGFWRTQRGVVCVSLGRCSPQMQVTRLLLRHPGTVLGLGPRELGPPNSSLGQGGRLLAVGVGWVARPEGCQPLDASGPCARCAVLCQHGPGCQSHFSFWSFLQEVTSAITCTFLVFSVHFVLVSLLILSPNKDPWVLPHVQFPSHLTSKVLLLPWPCLRTGRPVVHVSVWGCQPGPL